MLCLLFRLLCAAAAQENQCSPCRHLPFISGAQGKGCHTETGHHLLKVKFSCKCHGRSQWYMCEVPLVCYYESAVLLVLPIFCKGLCTFTVHFDTWWSICSTAPRSALFHSLDLEHTYNFPPTIPAGSCQVTQAMTGACPALIKSLPSCLEDPLLCPHQLIWVLSLHPWPCWHLSHLKLTAHIKLLGFPVTLPEWQRSKSCIYDVTHSVMGCRTSKG